VRRSNQLVLAGIAFFVVGVVIVLLIARDDGGSSSSSSSSGGNVPVLVAKEALAANTKGEDAVTKVEVKQIKAAERLPDALSSPSQLSSTRFIAAFAKGEQIRQSGLTPTIATIAPPPGKEAVPVQIPFVAGGAGYIAPGDFVNVYQVVPNVVSLVPSTGVTDAGAPPPALPYSTPRAELLLTKALVLDVNTQIASLSGQTTTPTTTQVQSRPSGGDIIVVLALDTLDTEKIIFGSQVQGLFLYLTKVDKDGNPAGPTPGQDYLSILAEEANDAYARTNK
jgi:Flp pilus assembly protein CpaB